MNDILNLKNIYVYYTKLTRREENEKNTKNVVLIEKVTVKLREICSQILISMPRIPLCIRANFTKKSFSCYQVNEFVTYSVFVIKKYFFSKKLF